MVKLGYPCTMVRGALMCALRSHSHIRAPHHQSACFRPYLTRASRGVIMKHRTGSLNCSVSTEPVQHSEPIEPIEPVLNRFN